MVAQTTGTLIRPTHLVAGPALTFDLADETAQLHHEVARSAMDCHAKTLIKEADFSVVLLAMGAGAVVRQHVVPAEISLHMLTGHLRLDTSTQKFDLLAGELVVLDRGVPFRLEAQRGSSFLLTVARHALEALAPLTRPASSVSVADTPTIMDATIAKVTYRFLERRTPFLELTFQTRTDLFYQRWIGERASQFLDLLHISDAQALAGMRCKISVSGNIAEFRELGAMPDVSLIVDD